MAYSNTTGLPSVTTIFSPWIDTQWFTKEARDRGSAVHDHCANHLLGNYCIPLKSAWRGYVDSFKRWCDKAKPEVHLVEKRLKDVHLGYCGQPDFIATVLGRAGKGLIDIKTGISVEKYWPLQGGAYRYLAKIDAGIETDWGFNLRLRSDGSMPLCTQADQWDENIAMDFNRFLGALNLWKYFNK